MKNKTFTKTNKTIQLTHSEWQQYTPVFIKKLGSNSGKFNKLEGNWWGMTSSWLTWDDIDGVKVTNGPSNGEKWVNLISIFTKTKQ